MRSYVRSTVRTYVCMDAEYGCGVQTIGIWHLVRPKSYLAERSILFRPLWLGKHLVQWGKPWDATNERPGIYLQYSVLRRVCRALRSMISSDGTGWTGQAWSVQRGSLPRLAWAVRVQKDLASCSVRTAL